MKIKITETLYYEIEYYNLPSSLNGFSKESYSQIEEEQKGYEDFCNSWEGAKCSGKYRTIELRNDEEIKVAVHCIDNVKHFAGSAASEPRYSLERHCRSILDQILRETSIKPRQL